VPNARWFNAQRAQAAGRFSFMGYHPAMQLSAQLAMWGCTVFSLTCFGFAIDTFLDLAGVTDPTERAASMSYVWFWTFLGVMVAAIAAVYWRMLKKASQQSD
jgi:hypothetical protein